MALKAYNNGVKAKEIRCVDAGGVERLIREIRKGDVQWWRGEFDPPTIQGTWTKVSDGLYQTKAIIPSYTTPDFLNDRVNTNYVIVSFHSYDNYVTCEFFGDFEGLTIRNSDASNGLTGEFYVTYSWDDASGNGEQAYKCSLNVFPKSNGIVTKCQHRLEFDPAGSFVEDSSFVSSYGSGWVVQDTSAHNKMCSDAYGYYSETTVDPWGQDGRTSDTWYNWPNSGTQVINYICANNGRAFSVKSLSGSVSVKFCPPGGGSAGWTASTDSARFPSSSGWYQKTKKDGYTKYFNVSTGQFAEYLPKEMFKPSMLTSVRSCIGTHLSDSEYADRVVCTAYNTIHLVAESKLAERKTNSSLTSDYDTEFWFDLYAIPIVNLTTGEWIYGHYNPSVPPISSTDSGSTLSYTVSNGKLFRALITMTFSTGDHTLGLELDTDFGPFNNNTFITGTFPAANYKYTFDQSNMDYVALIVACVANYGSDVVGDYHEYRLPIGATYELSSVTFTANGTNITFSPNSGYVKGTVNYTNSSGSYVFVIRPQSIVGSYYHQIAFNYTSAIAPNANYKNLEISSNLAYYGTTTYSTPQDSLSNEKKLVPVYWRMYADVEDRANQSLDGTRYMTSSKLTYPITLTMDWDPEGEVFTEPWWSAYYVLPITTSTPMTVAKATFLCSRIDKYYSSLPGIGSLGSLGISFSESHSTSWSQIWNGVFSITMTRSTGVVLVTSTAKANLPRVGENIYTYSRYYGDNVRYLLCSGNPDGDIVLDMFTGEWEWDS